MLRGFLLSLGCIIAGGCLYLAVLLLELYWNLYEWEPKWDSRAAGVLITVAACITAMAFLSRGSRTRLAKIFGCLFSLVLLGLGLYVLAPEPLSQGLFGRSAPSPDWYRFSRLTAMGMPLLFWLWSLAGRRSTGSRGRVGPELAAPDRLARPDAEAKQPTS